MTREEWLRAVASKMVAAEVNQNKSNAELANILNVLANSKNVATTKEEALDLINTTRGGVRPKSSGAVANHGQTNAEISAPYRFVALNDRIAMPEPAVVDQWREGRLHDEPLSEGMCGEIAIDIEFDTPMLIGDGGEDQQRPLMIDGAPVIPGATLRGLVRSTLEIAAFARLSQTNLHRRFAVRDFAHPRFTNEDRETKAGWLTRVSSASDGVDEVVQIEPCRDWPILIRGGIERDTVEDHLEWLGRPFASRYSKFSMKAPTTFDFSRSRKFSEASGEVIEDASGTIEGVYVFSDALSTFKGITIDGVEGLRNDERRNSAKQRRRKTLDELESQHGEAGKQHHKKRERVFEDQPNAAPIQVPPQVWRNFKANNSKPSRHKPEPDGNWLKLFKTFQAGRRIPVFYIENVVGEIEDMGLTRVFKRAHSAGIEEVLHRTGEGCHKMPPPAEFEPDFVEALFGYVHEGESDGTQTIDDHNRLHLKGRVGFSFAKAEPDCWQIGEEITGVLSAPRPSFGPYYLAGGARDWSDSSAQLAGRKRYIPRGADNSVKNWFGSQPEKGTEATRTKMKFLEAKIGKPLRFSASLRVHNITEVELGGLLWCLSFGADPSKRHMIGRAKMAGAGQAKIVVGGLAMTKNDGSEPPDTANAMKSFVEFMGAGWEASGPVRELLASSTPGYSDGKMMDYLPLNKHRELKRDDVESSLPRLLAVKLL